MQRKLKTMDADEAVASVACRLNEVIAHHCVVRRYRMYEPLAQERGAGEKRRHDRKDTGPDREFALRGERGVGNPMTTLAQAVSTFALRRWLQLLPLTE